MIIPSRLTNFVKDIEGTVVINPGTLVKGVTGGTYADFHIHPIPEQELNDAKSCGVESLPHNLPQRVSANILKI
jgi:hypothetical protein